MRGQEARWLPASVSTRRCGWVEKGDCIVEISEFEAAKVAELQEMYVRRRMGRRVGFGHSPCVLVIDFVNAFTNYRGDSPLASNLDEEVAHCARIVAAARAAAVPIIYTTVTYEPDLRDAGLWDRKLPLEYLCKGTPGVELDARLEIHQDDLLVEKKYASAFAGTPLLSYLCSRRIDTLIVAGCMTSGCVRASVVDAMQSGLHAIVVREAVGDRDQLINEISLSDIDSRYGDVVHADEALQYLESSAGRKGA